MLPEKKRDRFESIDKKLIDKYVADISKYQRARQKVKKQANIYFLRLENLAVLLHTEGDMSKYPSDDSFKDIRVKNGKLTLPISQYTLLDVVLVKEKDDRSKVTVKMSPAMYKGIKNSLMDCVLSNKLGLVYAEFNKLYGLPGYAGIIKQVNDLYEFTLKQCAKHQLPVNKNKLHINTCKTTSKVFKEGLSTL